MTFILAYKFAGCLRREQHRRRSAARMRTVADVVKPLYLPIFIRCVQKRPPPTKRVRTVDSAAGAIIGPGDPPRSPFVADHGEGINVRKAASCQSFENARPRPRRLVPTPP